MCGQVLVALKAPSVPGVEAAEAGGCVHNHSSSTCRHFFFTGPRAQVAFAVDASVMSCGQRAQAAGRCAVSEHHKVGGVGFYELLPPDMNNEDTEGRVCCFHTAVVYSVFPLCS